MCMRKRKKRGFTIIEAVVTISILAVVVSLISVVISNMVQIQNASTGTYAISEQFNDGYNIARDYISFVSVNDSNLAFTYQSYTDNSLTFSCDGYAFSLKYVDHVLTYGCDSEYTGSKDYLLKTDKVILKNITDFKFTYYDDIYMLKMEMSAGTHYSHEVFILRTVQ